MHSSPSKVYADGGVIGPNPSKLGGTWAFVWVADEVETRRAAGVLLPADIGLDTVTNNMTEFAALLHAIEPLPDGWAGELFTDSIVTLRRFRSPRHAKMQGIPEAFTRRLVAAVDRLGRFKITLLAGHPTQEDLSRGSKKGTPVSHWNVLCDHLCGEEAKKFAAGNPRKVDQTLFGDDGNCLQACTATMLQVALADVPHFCKYYRGSDWLGPMQEWCAAHYKMVPVCLMHNDGTERLMALGGYSIASGKSPRYDSVKGILHACVYKGDQLYHDPHPDRAGLVEITDVIVFVPIDPARRR